MEEVDRGWIRNNVNATETWVWGTSVPQYGFGQSPGRGCGDKVPEANTKCEIRVQFLTFSCTHFFDFMNTGEELGQYFCANTQ